MRPTRSVLAPLASALVLGACGGAEPREGSAGEAGDPTIISGTVRGREGPEAGVWVIARTDELPTGFTKIVVTDDEGRFVLPELPDAEYEVWVRGYGLADSQPIRARPGQHLALTAAYPTTPQQEAAVYPASYWYSLMEVPAAHEFPGTGPAGNGIDPSVRTQADWIDALKQGCQLCHQLGNRLTREIAHIEHRFATTLQAWDARVQFGQRGVQMSTVMTGLGRERNLVLTMWDWGSPTSYVHDEITTDKRDPTVNAGGPVYGVSMSDDELLIVDPNRHTARELRVPPTGLS